MMMILSIASVISLGLFILIVYFALSKHSSLLVKRAAVIALILIGLALIVSLCIIFGEPTAILTKQAPVEVAQKDQVPVKVVKPIPILIVVILFLLFIAWIVYISLRDQRRAQRGKTQGV
jgi:formate hydrogenlyase subunit 3/multisubunit Na+/H+ antiporter MnhD subunit